MNDIPKLAISIMQPWAWLIVNGHKDIENRDWQPSNPGLRFRGEVAIHTGKKLDKEAHDDLRSGIHPVVGDRSMEGNLYPACFAAPVPTGGIVGVAEIIDVVHTSRSPWFVGKIGLVIRNARPVPFIAVNGQLGFFEWRKMLEKSHD